MKSVTLAATAGLFAVALSGAAFAQSASGAMPNSENAGAPAPAPAGQAMAPADQSAVPATASVTTTTDPSTGASVTNSTLSNGPVPDTPENRAKYGSPMSHAGKHTKPAGN